MSNEPKFCDKCGRPCKNGLKCGCMGNRKRVAYIAGPMRHNQWYNAPGFYHAEIELRRQGFDVINPHEQDLEAGFNVYALSKDHDWSTYPPGFDKEACYKRCIEAVTACDCIYMLKGWEESTGAKAELALAQWMGKQVVYEEDRVPERDAIWDMRGPGSELKPGWNSPESLSELRKDGLIEDQPLSPEELEERQARGKGFLESLDEYHKRKASEFFRKEKDLHDLEPGKIPCERCGEPVFPEDKTHYCFTKNTTYRGGLGSNPENKGVKGGKPTDTVNLKDSIGDMKLPMGLWPATATMMGCIGFLNGMLKYGKKNWLASGVRASIYHDACVRHLDAWFEGEDIDPDDNVPHLAAALCCLAIIVDAQAAGKLNDDRNYPGGYRKLRDELSPLVAQLKAKHGDKDPRHYTIGDKDEA